MEILSTLYLAMYALSGVLIARYVFANDKPLKRVFFGLALGLAMLIWLPVLFAFLFGKFNLIAQILALLTCFILGLVSFILTESKLKKGKLQLNKSKQDLKPFLLTVIPLIIIGWVLHINHTIISASDGSLHVGQCTFGDLCMHLGFISSISVQQTFPPDYSLLPGTALGYPFLCDSVSSTFYTLGSSLRFATLLPALYAYLIVVLGVYFFFDQWFKKNSVTVLATYMFFIGGGLGFAYIFNNKALLAAEGIDRWQEMLTGFYKAPTNIPDEGLRWVNSIADMLVPQRATLFGWALLFPCLQLLYRAAMEKEYKLFIPLGILAGCLPLVHTHSFLALALISILLFVCAVRKEIHRFIPRIEKRLLADICGLSLLITVAGVVSRFVSKSGNPVIGAYFMLMLFIAEILLLLVRIIKKPSAEEASVSEKLKSFCIMGIAMLLVCAIPMLLLDNFKEVNGIGVIISAVFTLILLILTILSMRMKEEMSFKEYICEDSDGRNLCFFIVFGIIAVVLALPQVFGFTLKQASNDNFLRWQLNWDNVSDSYLWFYIKNLGLIFILMLPAFFSADKRTKTFYGGGLLIWLICEFILFQPNPYDNNKLLFVWFALTCGIVANYMVNAYKKLNTPEIGESKILIGKKVSNVLLAVFVLTAIFLSGTLTLYREYLSADHIGTYSENGKTRFGLVANGYEVLNAAEVEMAEWVKANTDPHAIILTQNNHNNNIAMLTGRNIFVGSGTFLHWHGVDYGERQKMLKTLFENPSDSLLSTAAEYGIEYVRIGSRELRTYNVDANWFEQNLTCVFSSGGEKLYKISE